MSEMVLVVPVMVLTAVVLGGILFVFRKYLAVRARLDAELAQASPAPRKSNQRPHVGEAIVRIRAGNPAPRRRAAA